jgi:hypothetical protein
MRRRMFVLALTGLFGAFLTASDAEAGHMKKKCKEPCASPCATPQCAAPCETKCKKPKKVCFKKKKKSVCEVAYVNPCATPYVAAPCGTPCGSPQYAPSGQATPQAPSKSM